MSSDAVYHIFMQISSLKLYRSMQCIACVCNFKVRNLIVRCDLKKYHFTMGSCSIPGSTSNLEKRRARAPLFEFLVRSPARKKPMCLMSLVSHGCSRSSDLRRSAYFDHFSELRKRWSKKAERRFCKLGLFRPPLPRVVMQSCTARKVTSTKT